jgi:hypothetical protein
VFLYSIQYNIPFVSGNCCKNSSIAAGVFTAGLEVAFTVVAVFFTGVPCSLRMHAEHSRNNKTEF